MLPLQQAQHKKLAFLLFRHYGCKNIENSNIDLNRQPEIQNWPTVGGGAPKCIQGKSQILLMDGVLVGVFWSRMDRQLSSRIMILVALHCTVVRVLNMKSAGLTFLTALESMVFAVCAHFGVWKSLE